MAASTCFVNNQALVLCCSHQLWLKHRQSPPPLREHRTSNRINLLSSSFSKSAVWTRYKESPLKAHCTQNISQELETITSEEQFNTILEASKQSSTPVLVDWMAAWCRKCIYLKPKLEKLATELQQHVKFYCVDVNTVPQSLVKRAGVNKMPTIQLWKDGEKCDEVIGGHQAWLVVGEVREMLQKHILDSTLE